MQGGVNLPRGVSIHCSTPDPTSLRDWSGGFSEILRHLPFKHRYLIHALITSHQLVIRSPEEARGLAAAPIEWLCDQAFLEGQPLNSSFVERCGKSISKTEIRRVFVTPLRICLQLPESDDGNRIIRNNAVHRDRFVRVTFADEDFSSARAFTSSEDVMDGCISRIVCEGMMIAGRCFCFLAFSSSQLKEQSAWFYDAHPDDPNDGTYGVAAPIPTADEIRKSMGDLAGIHVVGKFAARLGQGLAASIPTVDINPTRVAEVPDIEVTTGGKKFCFSDGIGMISQQLAAAVAKKLGVEPVPSAFQIRFKGCKGVVAVAPTGCLPAGMYMAVRPSMEKFSGNVKHQNLEVLAQASPLKCFLNRQIIVLLSAVGISDDAVMALFNRALADIKAVAHEDAAFRRLLRSTSGPVEQLGRNMLDAGFSLKARIHVPKAVSLIGVLDETKTMQPGSVFFQVSGGWDNPTGTEAVPVGTRVLVYRNPCLHPGDVQVFQTVDVPALRHLVDVLVFPATGDRPHPDELAGGDLDGDIYSVIWDPSLVPDHTHRAMEAGASAPPETVNGAITSKQLGDYFVNCMKNDNLGFIGHAHLRLADFKADGALNPVCLELAQLFSKAVDYNKTGVPATITGKLCNTLNKVPYPDFMELVGRKGVKSKKVLGVIYRQAKQSAEINNRILQTQSIHLDPELVVGDSAEGEVISGCVRSFSRKYVRDRYKDVHDAQHLNTDVSKLKQKYQDQFWKGLGVEEATLGEGANRMRAQQKASAWYVVAYEAAWRILDQNGLSPFFSFPWAVSDLLCEIKCQRVAQRPCG
eukprot:gene10043-7934_t